MSRVRRWTFAICTLAGGCILSAPASAQGEPFFRGKQVTILIGGTAGGGIDISGRLVSRYLGKYLPGNPTVVAQLMPGAGGIRLIDHMNAAAPKDGTVIAHLPPGPLIEPLVGKRKASYRMTDFAAVGAMAKEVSFCLAWHASPFKTIDDAKARPMTVAGTGAGATPDIYPLVLNEVLKTRFKVITGYQGSQETMIAIERGEVDGRCGLGWASLMSMKADWVRDRKLTFLLQLALTKHKNVPDVPLVMDLLQDDGDRQMLTLLFGPLAVHKPFVAPPGLPTERIADLRSAFTQALNDPELRAEMVRLTGDEPDPTGGEEMQQLIGRIYATPPAVADRLREVLSK